jgi:hypothetical protein
MLTTTHRRPHPLQYYCVQLKDVRDFLFRFWKSRSHIASSSSLFFRASSRSQSASSSSLSSVTLMWACISLVQISCSLACRCLPHLQRISSIGSRYCLLLSVVGIWVYHSGGFSVSILSRILQGWNKWMSRRGQRQYGKYLKFEQKKQRSYHHTINSGSVSTQFK